MVQAQIVLKDGMIKVFSAADYVALFEMVKPYFPDAVEITGRTIRLKDLRQGRETKIFA